MAKLKTISPRLPVELAAEVKRISRKTGIKQEGLVATCLRESLPQIEARWDKAMGAA